MMDIKAWYNKYMMCIQKSGAKLTVQVTLILSVLYPIIDVQGL